MANKKFSPFGGDYGVPTWSIDTTASINLGNTGPATGDGMVLQFRTNGSTFSAVIRRKATGSAVADGSAPVCVYKNLLTGVTAATAITADALCQVDGGGSDIIVTATMTDGTLLLEYRPTDA